jgi:hypothetical protein
VPPSIFVDVTTNLNVDAAVVVKTSLIYVVPACKTLGIPVTGIDVHVDV